MNAQAVFRQALDVHRRGDLAAASQLYQQCVALDPSCAEAWHWFGILHRDLGDPVAAVVLIGRAIALQPEAWLHHASLAEAHRALGHLEEAAAASQAALRIHPNSPEALTTLGAVLSDLGRQPEAEESLRRALALRPELAAAHHSLGIALSRMGRREEALEYLRRAAALAPGYAPVQANLGMLLLELGCPDEALEHAREAVRLAPTSAPAHDSLGNVLAELDADDEALRAYTAALELDPELAAAGAHLGMLHARQGRSGKAVWFLHGAVEREPDNELYWQWLGEAYDDLELFEYGVMCWENVLSLSPVHARAELSLGAGLQELGRFEAARDHLQAAVRLMPEAASAHLCLGRLHEQLGQSAHAENSFREALRLQPSGVAPLVRLGTMLRGKLPADDLEALEGHLASEEQDPGKRARLLFALAHVLDGRGEYRRAAEAAREANALTLSLNSSRAEHSPADHRQFVQDVRNTFDRSLFQRLAGAGDPSRRPVFVFGLPRSGTTLIEQVLSSHSQVFGAGELGLARKTFDALPGIAERPGPPCAVMSGLTGAEARRAAELHLRGLHAHDEGRWPRIVDKTPENHAYLGLLAVLFPNALFIHCRRDPRDVAVSCWMTDFRSIRWANHADHMAARFHDCHLLMDHWRAVLPVAIQEVHYEDTVADLESVARRLIAAAGLEWEPGCLAFHQSQRPVRTASLHQVREPIYGRSVARWKHYEPALGDLFAMLPEEV